MDNSLVYDREIAYSFNQLHPEHKQVLEWVGSGKKVLEVGCHTGYFSCWLTKNNCQVTGTDIFEPALERAKPYLYKSVAGNIEDENVWPEIAEEKYDVILFMHILEHLVNPNNVLAKAKGLLNAGGIVIICLPNINNWEDRWKIFKGQFAYTDTGVMDKTHLRFFNYYTSQEMIVKSGYQVTGYSGKSWKAAFEIVPNKRLIWRLNLYLTKIFHRYGTPNLVNKVLMFKAIPSQNPDC